MSHDPLFSMCTNATFEELPASAIFHDIEYENTAVNNFYHISYVFLGTIGLSTTLIFGLISAILLNKYQTGKYFTSKDQPPNGSTWSTRIRFEGMRNHDVQFKLSQRFLLW